MKITNKQVEDWFESFKGMLKPLDNITIKFKPLAKCRIKEIKSAQVAILGKTKFPVIFLN
jgi:hypothetical protein